MSEWYGVKNKDDIELSDDKKSIHVLFNTNYAGNCYVEIPVDWINYVMIDWIHSALRTEMEAMRRVIDAVKEWKKGFHWEQHIALLRAFDEYEKGLK